MYNSYQVIIAEMYVPVGWVGGVSTLLVLTSCEEEARLPRVNPEDHRLLPDEAFL